jgi:hypothetical protein
MRLSDDTLPTHLNELSSSPSTPAEAISASSDRPRATPPMAIAAASTTNASNASFPAQSDASTPVGGGRRARTRTSPVASHLLLGQAHNALTSMRIAPSPNLMFRGDASSLLELAARRRDLSHILSNENLRKLASAYEQLDYSTDVLQFSSLPPPSSLPSADVSVARSLPPTRVSERAGNVAVPSGTAATARPIVIGSAPSNLSAGFASFDDDDDDDDDNDNDSGARRSASVTTGVSFEATREELECSLCFRLFYQVSRCYFSIFRSDKSPNK